MRERSQIPVAARAKAQRIAVENGATRRDPNVEKPDRRAWKDAYEGPWQRRTQEVVVYTAPWCGWCQKTLAHLRDRDVRFVEKDIEANPAYHSELLAKTGRTSIPAIEVGGEWVRGYNPAAIDRLIAN